MTPVDQGVGAPLCSLPAPRGSDYLTATAAAFFEHCAHFSVAMRQAKAHHKEDRFRGSNALSPRDHGQHAIMAPAIVLQEMCDDEIAVSSHGQCRRMVDNMLEKWLAQRSVPCSKIRSATLQPYLERRARGSHKNLFASTRGGRVVKPTRRMCYGTRGGTCGRSAAPDLRVSVPKRLARCTR